MANPPAPINVKPSGQIIGNDGSWYTFGVNVGTPPQTLQLLPSTLIAETMVVNMNGCEDSTFSNCQALRGGLFSNTSSSSWKQLVNGLQYSLNIDTDLGIPSTDGGYFGYDTVGVTSEDGQSISLPHQVVIQYSTDDFYVGSLGLSRKESAIMGNNQTSMLTTLFDKQMIPTLGYSYTAGSFAASSPGSLVLGGQDQSLFAPNTVNFTMAQNGGRDLIADMQAISVTALGASLSMLPEGIAMFIDTTQPYMWLPQDACDKLADFFGLQQDEISGRYELNTSTHTANMKLNPSLTFQLGNSLSGGPSVNITFPYSSFNLNYTNENVEDPEQKYMFPIQAQINSQDYTIGRAFFQNAYLSVNYEYSNFSISQAILQGPDYQPQIVSLPSMGSVTTRGGTSSSPGTSSSGGSSGLAAGAIAGIVVGVLAVIAIILAALCLLRRRRRRESSNTGGFVSTSYSAPETAMPPELENRATPPPPMEQRQGKAPSDYFALDRGSQKFQQRPYDGPRSSGSSMRGELDSDGGLGYSSGMSSPRDATTAYHATTQELAAETLHELPERSTSVRVTSRMSEGPSPSLNLQPSGVLPASPPLEDGPVTRDVRSWGEGTHYEDRSPMSESGRPSMFSASSMAMINPGSPSLVSHTTRTRSISSDQAGAHSPAHSPGPSMDESILAATTRGYNTNLQGPVSPSNPIRPIAEQARDVNRSQETLVGSHGEGGGRGSPPPPQTPMDDFVTNSPEHGSLGYGSQWEHPSRRH